MALATICRCCEATRGHEQQYHDPELGLCYNRYRYFDTQICSFISQDPIGLAGGENVYAYAPNVWGWVDPLGLSCNSTNYATAKPYGGVKQASQYLKEQGVPRNIRKEVLESFDRKSMSVRTAGPNEYGIRYYDDVNSWAKGRYLFDSFPASRQDLALKPEWNQMTKLKQWKIKEGATILEGPAASQGAGLEGGQIQKYILNLDNLLEP